MIKLYVNQNKLIICIYSFIYLFILLTSFYININLKYITIIYFIMIIIHFGFDFIRITTLAKQCTNMSTHKIIIGSNIESELIGLTLKRLTDELNIEVMKLKQEKTEYVEYIDLWTHEIKLAIANFKILASDNYSHKLFSEIESIEASVERIIGLSSTKYLVSNKKVSKIYIKEACNLAIKQEMNNLLYKNIKINVSLEDEQVLIDKYWLAFCIRQIINNSIKYHAQTISFDWVDNKLIISDDGVGINMIEEELIFNKFYCANKTKKELKSTGIGLFITKQIITSFDYKVYARQAKTFQIIIDFNK